MSFLFFKSSIINLLTQFNFEESDLFGYYNFLFIFDSNFISVTKKV